VIGLEGIFGSGIAVLNMRGEEFPDVEVTPMVPNVDRAWSKESYFNT
jgi:hypothetical protein